MVAPLSYRKGMEEKAVVTLANLGSNGNAAIFLPIGVRVSWLS